MAVEQPTIGGGSIRDEKEMKIEIRFRVRYRDKNI